METKEAIAFIREKTKLDDAKEPFISKDELSKLLDITEKYSSDSLVLRESRHKAELEGNLEVLKSVFMYGQSALKTMILINGGAAIAVMAFLARYISVDNQVADMKLFLISLLVFGMGVLLGSLTIAFTYLTQLSFAQDKDKLGTAFHGVSIVLGISSLLIFAVGVYFSYLGFESAFNT